MWPQRLKIAVDLMLASPLAMIILWGPDLIQIYNDAYARILGAKHPAGLGQPTHVCWPEVWYFNAPIYKAVFQGEVRSFQDQHLSIERHGLREDAWFDLTYSPLHQENAVAGVLVTVVEVTDKARAEMRWRFHLDLEQRLRTSQSPLEVLAATSEALGKQLEAGWVAYMEINHPDQFAIVEHGWNDGAIHSGAAGHQMRDLPLHFMPDLRQGKTIVIGDVCHDRRIISPEALAMFSRLSCAALLNVPLIRAGQLVAVFTVYSRTVRNWTSAEVALAEDIAERTQAALELARLEKAQRESEARLRALVTATSYVVYRMSPDWTEMRQLDGRDFLSDTESPSENWLTQYIYPEDQPHVLATIQAAIRTRGVFDLEHRVRRADGDPGWTHSRAVPLLDAQGNIQEWFGTASDVTTRKRAEEALAASETRLAEAGRMEAPGRLAGGMAHDFNNILQAVQSRLHFAGERMASDPEEARIHVKRALEAVARATAVTGRLLMFARHSELHAEPIAPARLLAGLADMLAHTLSANITLRVEADPDFPTLYADQGQLESVLVNLANNARDAMPGGGTLTLRAAIRSTETEDAPPGLAPGTFMRISVVDDGEGMPAAVIARVTEPFFTTKPQGKGTGLGLAMARGFADQSGGTLTIESTLGHGTVVSLWLPLASRANGRAPWDAEAPVRRTAAAAPGSALTVLLAEDQLEVREVLALHLEECGFTIAEADHAAAALDLFDGGLRPDAVVTDLSMPGDLDGIGLIEAARRRWPRLPAVLVTGDAGVTVPDQLAALERSGAFALLRKPVSAKVLIDHLTRVLAQ